MQRFAVLALALLGSVAPAAADPPTPPWYSGAAGQKRLLHLSISLGGGLIYLGSQTVFSDMLASEDCRWCYVPYVDRAARNSLVWDDTRSADITSSVTAYIIAPVVGIGLLYLSDRHAGLPRFLDDTIPVLETVVLTSLVVQAMKFSFARERPFVHFGSEVAFEPDHNRSFPSGHSALGFAITTSAGMVCHWRKYWTEPYVWGAGITLSLTTEYLRIAADKHYLTDVLAGGLIGAIGGYTIPRLMREDVTIVPLNNGVAVVGEF